MKRKMQIFLAFFGFPTVLFLVVLIPELFKKMKERDGQELQKSLTKALEKIEEQKGWNRRYLDDIEVELPGNYLFEHRMPAIEERTGPPSISPDGQFVFYADGQVLFPKEGQLTGAESLGLRGGYIYRRPVWFTRNQKYAYVRYSDSAYAVFRPGEPFELIHVIEHPQTTHTTHSVPVPKVLDLFSDRLALLYGFSSHPPCKKNDELALHRISDGKKLIKRNIPCCAEEYFESPNLYCYHAKPSKTASWRYQDKGLLYHYRVSQYGFELVSTRAAKPEDIQPYREFRKRFKNWPDDAHGRAQVNPKRNQLIFDLETVNGARFISVQTYRLPGGKIGLPPLNIKPKDRPELSEEHRFPAPREIRSSWTGDYFVLMYNKAREGYLRVYRIADLPKAQ